MEEIDKQLIAAEIIAETAHKDQVDKNGEPYIRHVIRVAEKAGDDTISKMVSLLHDVLENSTFTAEDLRKLGFPKTVVDSVEILTHREGESYDRYIQRIHDAYEGTINPYVKWVKIADIEDNCDIKRLYKLDEEEAFRMFKKYYKAYRTLMSV